jgi:hypothetical protein
MALLKSLCLALCSAAMLSAATIDYKFASSTDLQTALFNFGGVTVTGGPRLIFVNVSNGLSIIGGTNSSAVDPGEFLDFSFNAGPASAVSFFVNNILDVSGVGAPEN